YTAVETINGEQLIYPNGPLTKGQMTILGRDEGESARWCRSVQFDTDARRPPAAVIAAVTRAMEDSAIDGIVAEPPPECLLAELNGNNARYQVRFFINALEREPAIASQVRTRVHYALRRGGLPLGQSKPRNEGDLLARRMRMLSRVDLFADLPEEERTELAKSLRPVPFAPGEILTRQDEEADCLYIIHRGRVSVRVTRNGLEREAASLGKNSFFGELSVLTGERRSATVVAVTHVHCYRLKKSAFDRLLVRQPELAELMAAVLVRRLAENAAAREGLNAEARARQLAAEKNDLLLRIRAFFRIGETSERPEVAKQKLAG
ncbi:MAG TPA: cyclic nucleotide-binding domain-containing protein, partial [Myxococcaceae bacterium]|nr:cyclic nucleotide-binding domain-containing protein [Myxococcaceae bacterium]